MTEWNVETALNHHAGCSIYDNGVCTCGLESAEDANGFCVVCATELQGSVHQYRACWDALTEQRNEAEAQLHERDERIERLVRALRGLLLSRDAAWTGGHDWEEAVKQAVSALGIEPESE